MPQPDFHGVEELFSEHPQKDMEIIGVGTKSRKSRTWIENLRQSYLLTRSKTHLRMSLDILRFCHAWHNTRTVYEENEAGDQVAVGEEPDVLTDEQIIARYSGPALWVDFHQEIVDTNVSVQGFSVKAATHLPDEEQTRREQSSAGAERRDKDASRW